MMFKTLPIAFAFSLAAGTTMANTQAADYGRNASIEETTGLFGGAIVGALAGGPPGAIVGAAIGALTGDGIRAKRRLNDVQADTLMARMQAEALREENEMLVKRMAVAQQELERLRGEDVPTLPVAMSDTEVPGFDHNLSLTLHFRTGSAELEPHYEAELSKLIAMARQMPTARIEITGYADRNGDAAANLRLSRQRSDGIKAYLSAAGIDQSSVTTVAYGDTRPTHESPGLETDFFDRRVIVRLLDSRQQMLSSSPDAQ